MKDPTVFQITMYNGCISPLSSIHEQKICFKVLFNALLIALYNTTPNTPSHFRVLVHFCPDYLDMM